MNPYPKKVSAKSLPRRRNMFQSSKPTVSKKNYIRYFNVEGSPVLEAGTPLLHSNQDKANRITSAGLSESELLAALNYLDESALQEFPSIGPAIAAHIIQHRANVRYFSSIEELVLVKLIGKKRFKQLVGREPEGHSNQLHTLMRVNPEITITVNDLKTWNRPAPDIDSIHLGTKAAQRALISENETKVVKAFGIGRLSLTFLCTREPESSRAHFLINRLPKILRSLNYERSLTATN